MYIFSIVLTVIIVHILYNLKLNSAIFYMINKAEVNTSYPHVFLNIVPHFFRSKFVYFMQ